MEHWHQKALQGYDRQIINEMLVYGYLEMTDDEYPVLSVADITKIDDNWNFEIKIQKKSKREERKIQTKKRKKAGAVAALAEVKIQNCSGSITCTSKNDRIRTENPAIV